VLNVKEFFSTITKVLNQNSKMIINGMEHINAMQLEIE